MVSLRLIPSLPDMLWPALGAFRRSDELTPLYVDRFRGVRTATQPGYHEFWELVCNRGTAGMLVLGPETVPFLSHEMVLLPPRTLHIEYSARPMDMIWVGLRGSALLGLEAGGVRRVRSEELSNALERTWLFSRRGGGIGPELDGRVRALLAGVLRAGIEGARNHMGDLVARGIRAIHERIAEPLAVSTLARLLGCSEGYFHRTFRLTTGKTPNEYVSEVRVAHAKRLLADTGMSIQQVAELTGYADPLYFSRIFKRWTGLAPSDYRKARPSRQVREGVSTRRRREAIARPRGA